jgi:hypothetical protein
MLRIRSAALACLASAACTPTVRADEVTIPASHDVTLFENMSGDVANGSGDYFFTGRNAVGSNYRSILRFDIAGAVPAGATIESVSLRLFLSRTSSGTFPATLHRALRDWGEGASDAGGNEGSGFPAQANDATWLYTFFNPSGPSPEWTNQGGDFEPAASASTNTSGSGLFYTWTSAQMALDAQAWLDDPAANFGWFLRGNETTLSRSSKRFHSRSNIETARRPSLTIVYSAKAPCPADIAAPFGVLDLADVQAFIAGFISADPIADLAPPEGVFDLADVQAFIASFNAGCP